MKTFNSSLVVLVAALSLIAVGCGKSENFQSNAITPLNSDGSVPVSPDGLNSTVVTGTNQVDFVPVSFQEMNSYVAIHPLNDPKNFKLTVDLTDIGNGRYAGSVKISYLDTGVYNEGTFQSGSAVNSDAYKLLYPNVNEAEYNRWFVINGKYYFSAFFQDTYGAVVLVFDNYVNQGDAQGAGTVSGSVYYKNFRQAYASQSGARKCWFMGPVSPYYCRAAAVADKTAIYPEDGYRKLGTFSGLSKTAAMK